MHHTHTHTHTHTSQLHNFIRFHNTCHHSTLCASFPHTNTQRSTEQNENYTKQNSQLKQTRFLPRSPTKPGSNLIDSMEVVREGERANSKYEAIIKDNHDSEINMRT